MSRYLILLSALALPLAARAEGVVGGVGLYLVKPHFGSNPAYLIERENQNPPVGTGTFHNVQRVDIDHQTQASPLVWLGYVGENGLGGRARYWSFRAGTDQAISFPATSGSTLVTVFSATPLGLQGFGDTLSQPDQMGPGVAEPTQVSVTSKLELHVLDLEAVAAASVGEWELLGSVGVRLARLAQRYDFYNLQPTTNPLTLRALRSAHDFEGAGPVLAVEARRPLGEYGLTLFGSGRGAILFGSAEQDATFGGTRLRNNDANPQTATQSRDRALPVVEVELGLEYGLCFGETWLFGQVALVGQDWLGAGNASRSAGNTFREGAPVGGVTDDSDLAFLGVAFRLGVSY